MDKKISVSINTPFIKMDSLLKFSGACVTGGSAKELLQIGVVVMDGETVTQRGRKVYPGALVHVGDCVIEVKQSALT